MKFAFKFVIKHITMIYIMILTYEIKQSLYCIVNKKYKLDISHQ